VNDPALITALARLREDAADQDAWEILYHSLRPYLFAKLFRRFRGRRHLAEEAAQDVMKALVDHLDLTARELTPASLTLYCNRTINSVFADWARKRENAENTEFSLDDPESTLATLVANDPDPEQRAMTQEAFEQLMAKLDRRSQTITHHLIQGHSTQEIARSLGIAEKTAANLTSRLRARLREWFERQK
jgi:RNA polymerase sigma factor (sigma-70 family)